MNHRKTRSVITAIGAMATAALLTLGGVTTAQAVVTPNNIVDQMPSHSSVIITKLTQPETQGNAADGTYVPSPGGTPINDVKFTARLVTELPETGTRAWQEAVARLDITEPRSFTVSPEIAYEGTTGPDGKIVWGKDSNVPVTADDGAVAQGVYLISETITAKTPKGVIPGEDFFLTVPLTDPNNLDSWLNAIYVYPKNSVVAGKKTVANATDFVVGDTVTWTIDITNPSVRNQNVETALGTWDPASRFQVIDSLTDADLRLAANGVKVFTKTGTTLTEFPATVGATVQYTVEPIAVSGGKTDVTITFTKEGRAALAAAKQTISDSVVITLDTVVQRIGNHENIANYFTYDSQSEPEKTPPALVKYGEVIFQKKSSTGDDFKFNKDNFAEFRVYMNEDAAKAAQASATVDSEGNTIPAWGGIYSDKNENGYLDTIGDKGIFQTNDSGQLTVGGLRFTNFADGVTIASGDKRYQEYWLVETKALEGHQLLSEPVNFSVTTETASGGEFVITNSEGGGFDLPLTGGMGTALLTAGGIALLAVVLVVARRRRNESVIAD